MYNSGHQMDEFLDNIISMPSWSDDYNNVSNGIGRNSSTEMLGTPLLVSNIHSGYEFDSSVVNSRTDEENHAWCDLNNGKKRARGEEDTGDHINMGSQVYVAPSVPSLPTSAPLQQHQGQTGPLAAPVTIARPRVRARRGQATDPHSIAERLRRERIAERMKALQELVPNANKTDKASMLDEIIDYVKFLQLQVKVLSMSRLGGVAGAVAPLIADLPEGAQSLASLSRKTENGNEYSISREGIALTESQVARLMEEDMGSAMQYLQSKGLCLMPISLATSISANTSTAIPLGNQEEVSTSNGKEHKK